MNLRTLRKRAKFSQARLAEVAGVRAATVSDLETGRISDPHYSTITKLSVALGVSPADVAAAVRASAAEAAA